ncbi:MAG: hypothetical protein GXP02_03255 [Alphaproteobacteria bacterium]|nr:hypothetical protein [Alphaproteobacteria bacterium]
MSDPMEQFKVIFFEECSELLTNLEEGLMQMQSGDGDEETIHAVFRAVHSVKGGAGAFGFDRLVAFAHVQETLLDEIRAGALVLKPAYVEVLLQAYDILSALVAAAQSGSDPGEDYGADIARSMTEIMADANTDANANTNTNAAVTGKEGDTPDSKL